MAIWIRPKSTAFWVREYVCLLVIMVRNLGSVIRQTWVWTLSPGLITWSWASNIISLSLIFLLCKLVINVSFLTVLQAVEIRWVMDFYPFINCKQYTNIILFDEVVANSSIKKVLCSCGYMGALGKCHLSWSLLYLYIMKRDTFKGYCDESK